MKFLRLKGGLGNQVFQMVYLMLSSGKNEKLFIDVSHFHKTHDHDYAGANLQVNQILSSEYGHRLKYFKLPMKLSSFFWKLGSFFKESFYDDYFSDITLYPSNVDYRKFFNLTIDGYEHDFKENAVLIHVRKGDYNNAINSKIYFNCEVDYFSKAVDSIQKVVHEPKFYIMSNDNDWVRSHFSFLPNYTILEIEDPVLSFKVMTLFSNFIISNSTFSWWAAFLTKSKNVIAPEKWYLDINKNINLYPSHWVKV